MSRFHIKLKWLPFPLVSLLVCILAFGLQIPWLGFYLDDWIILNAYNQGGWQRLAEYAFLIDRPLVTWTWWIGFKLLGDAPIHWHLWTFAWRWLTLIAWWLCFREMWRRHSRLASIAALLFAVYPIFTQQPTAIAYSQHWMCFFLYTASLYMMILAVRQPARRGIYLAGSILLGAVQLFSQEFFVGLELLRPLVLWIVLRSEGETGKPLLKRTLQYAFPFLVLLPVFAVWRFVYMPLPGADRNTPSLLLGLFTSPLASLSKLAGMFFQDFAEGLFGTWYKTYRPELFTAQPVSNLLAWGIVSAAFGALWVYYRMDHEEPASSDGRWYLTAIPFGLAAMGLGFLPGWTIGKHIFDSTAAYNDRFGLAAMPGASLVLVGLVDWLVGRERYKVGILCLLIGLAVGQSTRNTTGYRWSWDKQVQFYWQLKWRAPGLVPPTAILGDGPLFGYMGSWANVSAILQMYAPTRDSDDQDYWYIDLNKYTVPRVVEDRPPWTDVKIYLNYNSPAEDSLVVHYQPENLQCLWVLNQDDQTNFFLSDKTRSALPLSNLDRIIPQDSAALRGDIFGSEPPHTWCYYFQKASLAQQTGDWGEILRLWKEAEGGGYHPHVGVEYVPFIIGAARSGDWSLAQELTQRAVYPKLEMKDYLCTTWQRLLSHTSDSFGRQVAYAKVVDELDCLQTPAP